MLVLNIRSFSYIHCACWGPFWFHFHSPPVLCIQLLNEKMENLEVVYKNIKQKLAFRRAHCERKSYLNCWCCPAHFFHRYGAQQTKVSMAVLTSIEQCYLESWACRGLLFHLQIYNQFWVLCPKRHPSPITSCLFCDTIGRGWKFIDSFASI